VLVGDDLWKAYELQSHGTFVRRMGQHLAEFNQVVEPIHEEVNLSRVCVVPQELGDITWRSWHEAPLVDPQGDWEPENTVTDVDGRWHQQRMFEQGAWYDPETGIDNGVVHDMGHFGLKRPFVDHYLTTADTVIMSKLGDDELPLSQTHDTTTPQFRLGDEFLMGPNPRGRQLHPRDISGNCYFRNNRLTLKDNPNDIGYAKDALPETNQISITDPQGYPLIHTPVIVHPQISDDDRGYTKYFSSEGAVQQTDEAGVLSIPGSLLERCKDDLLLEIESSDGSRVPFYLTDVVLNTSWLAGNQKPDQPARYNLQLGETTIDPSQAVQFVEDDSGRPIKLNKAWTADKPDGQPETEPDGSPLAVDLGELGRRTYTCNPTTAGYALVRSGRLTNLDGRIKVNYRRGWRLTEHATPQPGGQLYATLGIKGVPSQYDAKLYYYADPGSISDGFDVDPANAPQFRSTRVSLKKIDK
jgi:hypothetical protein